MLLYYITDRNQLQGNGAERRSRLLENIAEAARCRVNYIQLRERDLTARQLEKLASDAVAALSSAAKHTRLLINSRVDVAIASGADGVHLRSASDLSASDARSIFHKAGITSPVIAVSCHTLRDVSLAEAHGADFAVFGPVFEKVIGGSGDDEAKLPGTGLELLAEACNREAAASSRMPVLGLGGITQQNAGACIEHGAAGIAAIRLFQPKELAELKTIVIELRKLTPADTKKAGTNSGRKHPYQES